MLLGVHLTCFGLISCFQTNVLVGKVWAMRRGDCEEVGIGVWGDLVAGQEGLGLPKVSGDF